MNAAPPRTVPLCVRCGSRPRAVIEGALAYICAACHADPATEDETRDGLRLEGEGRARRYMVDRYGWAGGWTR